jgi:long-chain acyl-CoA synthetase
VATLVDDIGALKPTLFIGVPRVYDRIYAGISDKVGTGRSRQRARVGWAESAKVARVCVLGMHARV